MSLATDPDRRREVRKLAKLRKGDADLKLRLESIIAENGKDRVAAITKLSEFRLQEGQSRWVPSTENTQALTECLARMIRSAGRSILDAAISLAFTEESPVVRVQPVETPEDRSSTLG